jgi:hypothetical protein
VAGGRIVFVSDRHGIRGVREETQPALQLFVMDDDEMANAAGAIEACYDI